MRRNRWLAIACLTVSFVLSDRLAEAALGDGQSPATAGLSARQILHDGYSVGNGIYWIDPDGAGGNPPFQIYADMTRDGGGWTLVLKTWYQAGHYRNANAVGSVLEALTLKGNPYKLSDDSIRAIIGTSNNFDVLAEQTGFNHFYSSGNYEYAILRNYTGLWSWLNAMAASSTTTTLESRRRTDNALAWTGELMFGQGGAGINGYVLLNGPNPTGGSGCTINMGTASNPGWHHFYMADTNSDSYLYLCNGPQHSSSVNMNHLYWVRSRETQTSLPPLHADAGIDVMVSEGSTVILNGAGSTGTSLSYLWSQVSGTPVLLSGSNTMNPTFTAPSVGSAGSTLTFQLTVTSNGTVSSPDFVNVIVSNINQPPFADAGTNQTVQENSPVILNGLGSFDPDLDDTISYHWSQISGPPVTLNGDNTATPTFGSPTVGPTGETLVFRLIVTDSHGATGSASITVTVANVNQTPMAHAGLDQTVNEQTSVILNGAGSTDPDLDSLTYTWTQTSGPGVTLLDGGTATPNFTAPSVSSGGATLTFQLVVSDGVATSTADSVVVHVLDTNDPPVCTWAQPSIATLWPPNHAMVAVGITGITDQNNDHVSITYTTVTQDEPVNGLGDGDTSPDAAISGQHILLRSERAGTGNGRVYVVGFIARDVQGASCSGTVQVSVPHSKKDLAVGGAQLYNSFAP